MTEKELEIDRSTVLRWRKKNGLIANTCKYGIVIREV